jgi:hypothetical protein
MSLQSLTPEERDVVFACLAGAAYGPFFDEEEFHTLFGLRRHEVAAIADAAPDIDDADASVVLAINNSMNNLLYYPHDEEEAWESLIRASPAEVCRIFNKWRGGGDMVGDRAYWKGLM